MEREREPSRGNERINCAADWGPYVMDNTFGTIVGLFLMYFSVFWILYIEFGELLWFIPCVRTCNAFVTFIVVVCFVFVFHSWQLAYPEKPFQSIHFSQHFEFNTLIRSLIYLHPHSHTHKYKKCSQGKYSCIPCELMPSVSLVGAIPTYVCLTGLIQWQFQTCLPLQVAQEEDTSCPLVLPCKYANEDKRCQPVTYHVLPSARSYEGRRHCLVMFTCKIFPPLLWSEYKIMFGQTCDVTQP